MTGISVIDQTGLAAPLALTTPTIAQINSAASLTPTTFYDNAGVQVGTLCRAWVNFSYSSGVIINASFNVSSVTRASTGRYSISYTNAMPDSKYSLIGMQAPASDQNAIVYTGYQPTYGTNSTTTGYVTTYMPSASVLNDPANCYLAVFR
jgi:hypothetical protein